MMEYRGAMTWKMKLFAGSLFFHRLAAKTVNREVRISDKYTYSLNTYEPRAATVELMSREIYRYGIEGNTAELGVWRGDFARLINHYFPDRKLYLFDTFEGFDKRDTEADKKRHILSATETDWSGTSEELVLSKMEHPENCIIRKGWFPDTAQGIDEKFCFVSLDADLYDPLTSGLEFFYPRLVHGGVVMIHDIQNSRYPGAHKAVKDFCDKYNIGYVCLSDYAGSAVITR